MRDRRKPIQRPRRPLPPIADPCGHVKSVLDEEWPCVRGRHDDGHHHYVRPS